MNELLLWFTTIPVVQDGQRFHFYDSWSRVNINAQKDNPRTFVTLVVSENVPFGRGDDENNVACANRDTLYDYIPV